MPRKDLLIVGTLVETLAQQVMSLAECKHIGGAAANAAQVVGIVTKVDSRVGSGERGKRAHYIMATYSFPGQQHKIVELHSSNVTAVESTATATPAIAIVTATANPDTAGATLPDTILAATRPETLLQMPLLCLVLYKI